MTFSSDLRTPSLLPGARGAGPPDSPAAFSSGHHLAERFEYALAGSEADLAEILGTSPADERDAVLCLLRIHDLALGPVTAMADDLRRQHHPVVSGLKWRLEEHFLHSIERWDGDRAWNLPSDPVEAMRAIQATDRVPSIYNWLAEKATEGQIRRFLELEGGPDGGFDDLVAACQIGLDGEAKLELARNYWDEMGRGLGEDVHTKMHRDMSSALGLDVVPREGQPTAALERAALGSTLATNRWLQPEMLGALGLIELQAGPRCRKVVSALRRIGAPPGALRFYEEHAAVDPWHGRSWLGNVVAPLAEASPEMGMRIVRGARWRSTVNSRFMDSLGGSLGMPGGQFTSMRRCASPETQIQESA